MSKAKNQSKDSKQSVKAAKLTPRNPISLNPLMKKSHAHTKNSKAERAKNKQALNKELRERDLSE